MKTILPYQTIGIMGGGQLARMLALAAKAMGYKIAVLDPEPSCPAGQVADIEITAAYSDVEAQKKLAEVSDIITTEFENVHYTALETLGKLVYLPQGHDTLRICQNRFLEKTAISDMGIKVAEYRLISAFDDIEKSGFGYPSVLKTTTGGYDGKGQIVLRSADDLPAAKELIANAECILEKFVPYSMEVSVIVARSTTGETKTFPVSENIHVNNILHQSIVPARISPEAENEARELAIKIADGLGAVGLLGIEMFVVDNRIVINEIAPRPHNSGHYTIDACITSQFEQHIRAVCGLPLGETALHTPIVMVNILGDHMDKQNMSNLAPYIPLLPKGKIHLYGKAEARDKRKMGHICLLGDIEESLKLTNESKIWEA